MINLISINDNLVKLTYYISTKNIDFLEDLELSNKDLIKLFSFFNLLFKEYIGIETKSYKKIMDLEEMLSSK